MMGVWRDEAPDVVTMKYHDARTASPQLKCFVISVRDAARWVHIRIYHPHLVSKIRHRSAGFEVAHNPVPSVRPCIVFGRVLKAADLRNITVQRKGHAIELSAIPVLYIDDG